MELRMINLANLVSSKSNVRKTGAAVGLEEMMASILAVGLLQNLSVRSIGNGAYEVIAGGRRLAALKQLAKQKKIDKDYLVGCNVLGNEDATEIGLAENAVRMKMHPADEFEAFKALADQGRGPEAISARFGVTPHTVIQRLKLAAVSQRLMQIYRDDKMTLDHLMAFTVSDDHKAQEAAWFDVQGYLRNPDQIRRRLTHSHVPATDDRARYVGIQNYITNGGAIIRDLFDTENEGYLTDVALLDKLTAQKLHEDSLLIQAEGWKWVEVMPKCGWDYKNKFGRVYGKDQPLSTEQKARLKPLEKEEEKLQELDELDDEQNARLDELQNEIRSIEPERVWSKKNMAISGAIVTIDDGALEVVRGLVRKEDQKAAKAATASSSASNDDDDASDKDNSGLSGKLIEDLTAHRTAALQTTLADNPKVALAAVVHAMAMGIVIERGIGGSCLKVSSHRQHLGLSAKDIEESTSIKKLETAISKWEKKIPQDSTEAWPWLLKQDQKTLLEILAVCAGGSVDSVQKPYVPAIWHVEALSQALDLDMADWYKPTAENYFSRVSKEKICEAWELEKDGKPFSPLPTVKKAELAEQAEKAAARTGWLPQILRKPEPPKAKAVKKRKAA